MLTRVLIIFVLAFLAYASSLANGFAFDDRVLILDNPGIYSIGRSLNYFTHAVFPGDLYRPITMLSYGLNSQVWGLNPANFHLLNVLLHALASCLVFLLALEFAAKKPAFACAALFAVLPIHSEAVANVVGRAELLSSLFVLASLLHFLKSAKSSTIVNSILTAVFLFCGLLSKESAVSVLLLYPLLAYYKGFSLRQVSKPLLLIALSISAWLICRSLALGALIPEASQTAFIDNALYGKNFFERLPAAISILGRYLGLSLMPVKLSSDYSYPALVPFVYDFYESVLWFLFALLGIAGAVIGVKKKQITGLFLAWFFLAFAITSNVLVPIGTIMGERLAYLPSVGAAALLAWLISQPKNNAVKHIGFIVLCISFLIIADAKARVWKSNETLHRYQIAVMPLSAKTQLNYAMVMLEKKQFKQADFHARRALELYPEYAHAAWALGEIYFQKGIYNAALHWFDKAQQIDSKHADSMFGLARIALAQGDLDKAEDLLQQTIKLKPGFFEADIGLLAIYIKRKDWERAESLAARMLEWNPEHRELQRYLEILRVEKSKG